MARYRVTIKPTEHTPCYITAAETEADNDMIAARNVAQHVDYTDDYPARVQLVGDVFQVHGRAARYSADLTVEKLIG